MRQKRSTRLLSLLLSLTMILGTFTSTMAFAVEEESAKDSAARAASSSFAEGTGAEGDPYQISTVTQLKSVANDLSASYILTKSLTISNEDWKPIGDLNEHFTGVFDGDGHTISGLTVDDRYGQRHGLFGYLEGATVKDLAVEVNLVNGTNNIGGLAGYASESIIDNCGVIALDENSLISGTNTNIGGLVGGAARTQISNCFATVNVKGGSPTGGLVGLFGGARSTVSDKEDYAVVNCMATGDVTGSSSSTGGLVGKCEGASVQNSFATGTLGVTSSLEDPAKFVGGIAGGISWQVVGGTGYQHAGALQNCYFTGAVQEGGAGVVGMVSDEGSLVEDCYYNSAIANGYNLLSGKPQADEPSVTAKTVAEMREEAFVTALNEVADANGWGTWNLNEDGIAVLFGVGEGFIPADPSTDEPESYSHYDQWVAGERSDPWYYQIRNKSDKTYSDFTNWNAGQSAWTTTSYGSGNDWGKLGRDVMVSLFGADSSHDGVAYAWKAPHDGIVKVSFETEITAMANKDGMATVQISKGTDAKAEEVLHSYQVNNANPTSSATTDLIIAEVQTGDYIRVEQFANVDNDIKNVRPVVSYVSDEDQVLMAKAELQKAYNSAEALLNGDYTAASLEALRTEVASAKDVLASAFATVEDCESAMAALQKAVDSLVPVVFTKLDQAPMAATAAASSFHDPGSATSSDGSPNWAFDGKAGTWWHSHYTEQIGPEHWIAWGLSADFATSYYVGKVEYQPRTTGGSPNGRFGQYVLEASNDNAAIADTTWTEIASGTWSDDANLKTIILETPVQATKLRLRSLSTYGNPANSFGSAQEINVYSTDATAPVEKGELQAVYDANANKEQGSYTQASWDAFTLALSAAKTVLDNPDATQKDVDDALTALNAAIAGLTTGEEETRTYVLHPYGLKRCMEVVVPVGKTATIKWEWDQAQTGYVPSLNGSKLRDDLTFDAAAIAPIVCNPISGNSQVVGGLQKIRAVPDTPEIVLAPTADTPEEVQDIPVLSHSPDVPFTVQYVDQDGNTVKEVQRISLLYEKSHYVGSDIKEIGTIEGVDKIEVLSPTFKTIEITKDENGNDVAIPNVVTFNVNLVRIAPTKDVTISFTLNGVEVGTQTITLKKGDPAMTIQAENPPEGYLLSPASQSAKLEYTVEGKLKINGSVVTGAAVVTFTVRKAPPPKAFYDIVVNGEKAFTLGVGEGTSVTVQWKYYMPPYIDGRPNPTPVYRLELVTAKGTYHPTTLKELDGTVTNGFKFDEIVLSGQNIDVTGAYNLPDDIRMVSLESNIAPMSIVLSSAVGDSEKYPASAPKQEAVSISSGTPVVTAVKVTHPNEKIEKGTTEHFAATVEGENVTQNVTWSVIGSNVSTIDENGVLTVPESEPYDIFRVRATSVDDPEKYGEVEVSLVPAGMPQGSGTEEDPYVITTAKEFNAIRNLSSVNFPNYFKLANDIDLSDYADTWMPIGIDRNHRFGGIIDGNGKTIRGLKVDQAMDYAGLFGYVRNTTIKDLTVEVVKVSGKSNIGALAGYANESTIIGCGVRAVSNDSLVEGTGVAVGGLIGVALYTTIADSYTDITVKGVKELGGLVGSFSGRTSSYVENCYANGNVISTNTDSSKHIHTGGLIGNAQKTKIRNCFATGDITATGKRIGGLTGTISGTSGGERAYIKNSYASGTMNVGEGSTWVGGLSGTLENSSTVLENAFYNSESAENGCGLVPSGLVDTSTGKTAAELKSRVFALELNANTEGESSWTKWGFEDGINGGQPVLCGVGVGVGVDEVTNQPIDQYVHYNVMLSNVGGQLQTNFEVDVKVGDSLQLGYVYGEKWGTSTNNNYGYWLTINGKKVKCDNYGKCSFVYNDETIKVGTNIGCITSNLPPENPPALTPTVDMVGQDQNVIMPLRDFTQNIVTIPIVAKNMDDAQIGTLSFAVDHYTSSDRFHVRSLDQVNIDVNLNDGYTIDDCEPVSERNYAVVMGSDGVAKLGTTSPAMNQFPVTVTKPMTETVTFVSAGNGFLNDLTSSATPVIETGIVGTEVPVPTTRPAKGCEFTHWTNSKDETVELGETVTVPLGGETYTAYFAKSKYTVRFEILDPKYGTLKAANTKDQVDPQTVEMTGYDYNTGSYPSVKPANGYTWLGWRDKNDPDGKVNKWMGTFNFSENITYEVVIVPNNTIDISYQFKAPGVEKPILIYSSKLFLNQPKTLVTENTIAKLAEMGYRLDPAEQANWAVLYSDVGDITLNGVPVEWQDTNTLITYTVVPNAPQNLTVSYGKNVKLSVNGEAQTLADLIGKYQQKKVESETKFTLTFTPRLANQAFRSVKIGDADPVLVNGKTYTYEFTMGGAETNLTFAFEMTDKTTLQQVYNYAKTYVEDGTVGKLVGNVQTAFMKAYDEAENVLDDPAATQAEINDAWSNLMDMIHYLEFVPGVKADLLKLLNIANSLKQDDYTETSWNAMVEARAEAQKTADDPEAMQNDINKSYDSLYAAIMALVRLTDRSQLDLVIEEANKILPNLNKYRPEGQDEFQAALAAAEDLKAYATQKQIDDAALRLSKAITALRLIPDKSALKALIEEVKNLDMSQYTSISAAACMAAVNYADGICSDPNATSEQIMQAYDFVQEMKTGLKKNTAHNGSGGSGNKGGSSYSGSGTAVATANPIVAAAQGVVAQASVRSDTTLPFTLKRGSAYCFKMTVVNGSTAMPSFTVGNGNVLKTQFVAKSGNDYYFRVWAVGTPGEQTGVYTQMPGENPQFHCAVTVG